MAEPLTDEQVKQYLQRKGLTCPYCTSISIECGNLEPDGPTATAACRCLKCSKQWTDIYTLTHVEAFDP